MIDFDLLSKNFKNLTKEQKIERLKSMLDVVREEWNIFQDFYDLIKILGQDISDNILETIYDLILWAMQAIKVEEIEENIEKMEKLRDYISNIKQKEKQEEEDVDNLLKKL